ncbi:hypothetical protein Tco_1259260 [Tanacetum coccineum]
MSNNKRHSKRKPKLPNKFNDHVMSNLSQKHKDVKDVDEYDAIRVHMDDKVEESREIGESSKEKVLEEGECVDEIIHRDTEDSNKNLQDVVEDNAVMGEKVHKGVFGFDTTDAGNDGSRVDMEGEGKGGNPKSFPDLFLSAPMMNANDNELFYIPIVMKENGEKVVVFDEELVKEGRGKWKYTV